MILTGPLGRTRAIQYNLTNCYVFFLLCRTTTNPVYNADFDSEAYEEKVLVPF